MKRFLQHLRHPFLLAGLIPDLENRITQTTSGTDKNAANDTLNRLWALGINLVYLILGALAVIMLVWTGIQYIQAGSAPEKVKTARQNLTNVILGIILLVASYTIIRFIVLAAGAVTP